MNEHDLRSQVNEFWKASHTLTQWLQGAFALALLRASLEAGILDATSDQRSLTEIASTTGLEIDIVKDVCEGLLQLGILEWTIW